MSTETQSVRIGACTESKSNPRGPGDFKGTAFDELVASIKEKGVLMPILVRPTKDGYEIIAGHRRARAAQEAGLNHVPARIVEMTDEEAREAQIVENLQRADIHPIEEGTAFLALVKPIAKTTGTTDALGIVAARVGKSPTYVRGRLALTDLSPEAQKAVPASHATLIASLEPADQKKAMKEIDEARGYNRPMPLATLRSWIVENTYTAAMKSPPWKGDEAMKAAIAEATGFKAEGANLFGEETLETIEDPAKYARAVAAFIQLTINEHEAAGKPLTLISDSWSGGKKVKSRDQYTLVSEHKGCKSGQPGLYVEGKNAGKIVKICLDKKCKACHPYSTEANETPAQTEKRAKARKAELAAEKAKKESRVKAIDAAVAKVRWPMTEKELDALLELAFKDHSTSTFQPLCKRLGIEPKITKRGGQYAYTTRDFEKPLREYVAAKEAQGKVRVLFHLLIEATNLYSMHRTAPLKDINAITKILGGKV